MSFPIWPVSLPQIPLREGNGLNAVSNSVVFEPDKGPPIKRAATTVQQAMIQVSLNLTEAQKDLFMLFFEVTLNFGTTRFQMIDPYTHGPREYQIEGETYTLNEISQGVYKLALSLRRVS
jgi:hypothetical protein